MADTLSRCLVARTTSNFMEFVKKGRLSSDNQQKPSRKEEKGVFNLFHDKSKYPGVKTTVSAVNMYFKIKNLRTKVKKIDELARNARLYDRYF